MLYSKHCFNFLYVAISIKSPHLSHTYLWWWLILKPSLQYRTSTYHPDVNWKWKMLYEDKFYHSLKYSGKECNGWRTGVCTVSLGSPRFKNGLFSHSLSCNTNFNFNRYSHPSRKCKHQRLTGYKFRRWNYVSSGTVCIERPAWVFWGQGMQQRRPSGRQCHETQQCLSVLNPKQDCGSVNTSLYTPASILDPHTGSDPCISEQYPRW